MSQRRLPVTVADIERVLTVTRVMLKPDTRPRDWAAMTIMDKLRREKRLSETQIFGFERLIDDVDKSYGKSGDVTSSWSEYVDINTPAQRIPVAFTNGSFDRLQQMSSVLTREEKALLHDMLVDFYDRLGGRHMEEIGFYLTGYKGKDQSYAATVGKITSLLNRIAAYYGRG